MSASPEILNHIPHRPPFLWVDDIVDRDETSIHTRKLVPNDLDVFRGHYPQRPIMPGVLLCEAIFQSGALLMSHLLESDRLTGEGLLPVLTRIEKAKFKRSVAPGDTLDIQVRLRETVGSVSFFKGTLRVAGKIAVQTEFACALVVSD